MISTKVHAQKHTYSRRRCLMFVSYQNPRNIAKNLLIIDSVRDLTWQTNVKSVKIMIWYPENSYPSTSEYSVLRGKYKYSTNAPNSRRCDNTVSVAKYDLNWLRCTYITSWCKQAYYPFIQTAVNFSHSDAVNSLTNWFKLDTIWYYGRPVGTFQHFNIQNFCL